MFESSSSDVSTNPDLGSPASFPPSTDRGAVKDKEAIEPGYTLSLDSIYFRAHIQAGTRLWCHLLDFCNPGVDLPDGIEPCGGFKRYPEGFAFPGGVHVFFNSSPMFRPNIYVRCTSKHIQSHYSTAWGYSQIISDCLSSLFKGTVIRFVPSRIDMALDFNTPLIPYIQKSQIFDNNSNSPFYVRTRKKTWRTYADQNGVTYFLWGGGTRSRIRLYDKLQELKNVPNKLYWHDVWTRRGFRYSDTVHRLEFEMHSETLSDWGIEDLQDFELQINAILADQIKLFSICHRKGLHSSRFPLVAELASVIARHGRGFIRMPKESPERGIELQAIKMKTLQGAMKAYVAQMIINHLTQSEKDAGVLHINMVDTYCANAINQLAERIDNSNILESVKEKIHGEGLTGTLKRQAESPLPDSLMWNKYSYDLYTEGAI